MAITNVISLAVFCVIYNRISNSIGHVGGIGKNILVGRQHSFSLKTKIISYVAATQHFSIFEWSLISVEIIISV